MYVKNPRLVQHLGACCNSCAHGGSCESSMGATEQQKEAAKGAFGMLAALVVGAGILYFVAKG